MSTYRVTLTNDDTTDVQAESVTVREGFVTFLGLSRWPIHLIAAADVRSVRCISP